MLNGGYLPIGQQKQNEPKKKPQKWPPHHVECEDESTWVHLLDFISDSEPEDDPTIGNLQMQTDQDSEISPSDPLQLAAFNVQSMVQSTQLLQISDQENKAPTDKVVAPPSPSQDSVQAKKKQNKRRARQKRKNFSLVAFMGIDINILKTSDAKEIK